VVLTLALLLAAASPAGAQEACVPAQPGQAPRAFLVTTSPGPGLYSAFGHAALWISGGGLAEPRVLDWGTFDSRAQDPVLAFLHSDAVYSLEAVTTQALLHRAQAADRSLVAQRLALPPDERDALVRAVMAQVRAPDRSFHYDWLQDNCATRIRDVLDVATSGGLSAQATAGGGLLLRGEVQRHLVLPGRGLSGRVLWWGVQLAGGPAYDLPLDARQAMFLPDRLMQAVRQVQRPWPDGQTRPLVDQECTLVQGGWGFAPPVKPAWPGALGLGLAWAAGIGLGARRARPLAALLVGLLGLLLLAVSGVDLFMALFTQVYGARETATWWLANPAGGSLLLAAPGLARGRPRRALAWGAALAAGTALLGALLWAVGLLHQDLAATLALLLPPLLAAAFVLAPALAAVPALAQDRPAG